MSIAQSILPEFDHEMANTRKTLERVPDDKFDWKAHEKSNSIGWVVSHLAEIPGWVEGTMQQTTMDINPPGGEPYQAPTFSNTKDALELFDKNVAAARAAIEAASDADFMQEWSLLNAGETMMSMPRIGCIRGFILNHTIHHRAHLCVYLRLNDIPVPALYGPSGDEEG